MPGSHYASIMAKSSHSSAIGISVTPAGINLFKKKKSKFLNNKRIFVKVK